MINHFIEFRGVVYIFEDEVTNNEAWLIVYNSEKENIVNLVKLWTCVTQLGCKYPDETMQQINKLYIPKCLTMI